MNRIYRLFESWIDPFQGVPTGTIPHKTFAFMWFFVRQAKLAFLAMLVLGGLVALIEAALFWFVGRLVDLLGSFDRAEGWAGLMNSHGTELILMLLTITVARTLVTA